MRRSPPVMAYRSAASAISCGVLRLTPPLPPATTRPRSGPNFLAASFIAPHVTVVTPELCQSKPSTQPNA